jgi:hypothetical protein
MYEEQLKIVSIPQWHNSRKKLHWRMMFPQRHVQ